MTDQLAQLATRRLELVIASQFLDHTHNISTYQENRWSHAIEYSIEIDSENIDNNYF